MKGIKYLLLVLLIPGLLYLLAVILGGLIPVNSGVTNRDGEIEIFLHVAGVHTDIVVPTQNELQNWEEVVSPSHSLSAPSNPKYISFGWGDLEFYRDTPEWKDLTLKTGFRALFLNTPSAVHLEFLNFLPRSGETLPLKINKKQYRRLSAFLLQSFRFDESGNVKPIDGLHYNQNDAFYHARGSLNLFYTCNTWVNEGLKTSGLRACLWTPFPEGILYTYRQYTAE